jgi:hypothetical protein
MQSQVPPNHYIRISKYFLKIKIYSRDFGEGQEQDRIKLKLECSDARSSTKWFTHTLIITHRHSSALVADTTNFPSFFWVGDLS